MAFTDITLSASPTLFRPALKNFQHIAKQFQSDSTGIPVAMWNVKTTNHLWQTSSNAPAATRCRPPRPEFSTAGFLETFFPTQLNRVFGDDFWGLDTPAVSTANPVNIRETAAGYELELVAPGLKKEDFHIDVEVNTLTVSFEHKDEQKKEDQDGKVLRREYPRQSFSRSFGLDDKVDASGISARYTDGILHLSVPKKPEAQHLTRVIDVQ